MTDMFHDEARWEWMAAVMDAMICAPGRTYIMLTKRPQNVLPWWCAYQSTRGGRAWPWHIWLGVSIENQEMMVKRMAALMNLPAPVKVVSFEPLLGHVVVPYTWARALAWMIAGPETGPGARPCAAEWIEALARQAETAGVAFFDKRKVGWIRREWPGSMGKRDPRNWKLGGA
jgi:protein gp37